MFGKTSHYTEASTSFALSFAPLPSGTSTLSAAPGARGLGTEEGTWDVAEEGSEAQTGGVTCKSGAEPEPRNPKS